MMGRLNHNQGQLFYSFHLDEVVPDDHLVRDIAAVLDLSWVHRELAAYYPKVGRPSIDPELMIRMLIVGYVLRDRKRVEMLFAHLKRILRLGRLRLRGPCGAQDEFTLAAIAQNLRRLAKFLARPPPAPAVCAAQLLQASSATASKPLIIWAGGRPRLKAVRAAASHAISPTSATKSALKGPSAYAYQCLLIGHDQTCRGRTLTAEFDPSRSSAMFFAAPQRAAFIFKRSKAAACGHSGPFPNEGKGVRSKFIGR
jgi:hypothetical protein